MLSRRRLGVGVLASAVIAAALLASPDAVLAYARTTLSWRWFPVVLVGIYLLRPFLGWPITLVSALVGFKYGLLAGVPIALAGCVVTSLPAFEAGRRLPTDGRLLGLVAGRSERYFDLTGGLRGLIAARLAPTPAEPVSAAAGIGGLSLTTFALGTIVGELPWTIAAVAIGAGLQTFDPATVTIDWRLGLLGGLAALVLVARPAYDILRA